MEERKEVIKIKEKVIMSWVEFEDFITKSFEGLRVLNSKGEEFDTTTENIMNELNVNTVEEIYYFIEDNVVLIQYINGSYETMYRE